MSIVSKDKQRANDWSLFMARMHARACIISRITGISNSDSRKIWKHVIGKGSSSGQMPTDDNWFLKTPVRRSHAALILALYSTTQKTMPKYAAFAHAYYHYARITAGTHINRHHDDDPAFRDSEDDYIIPFTRAYFLTQIYTDETMMCGTRKCKLVLCRCRCCSSLYLGHVEEIEKKCLQCSSRKYNQ